MSRTVFYTATSLDGFIADPNDSLDWLLRQPQDESVTGFGDYDEFFAEVGALVMGSTTYEWILGNLEGAWPYDVPCWVLTHRELGVPDRVVTGGTPSEPGVGDDVVADEALGAGASEAEDAATAGMSADGGSAAAASAVVPDVRFAQGSVADLHAELLEAAGEKDVWIVGGGDLAGQFADVGLLDEIIVSVAPVTLGAGGPLMPRRLELELLETGRNAGFTTSRYRVLGTLLEDRAEDAEG